MKIGARGILFLGVFSLIGLGILVQAAVTTSSSAAEPAQGLGLTPEPESYLPLVARQPTLTPTPTPTATPTPTPTKTPTPQPTVVTSAQYCHGPFLEIPDDDTAILFDTISVSDSGVITDLDVYISTTHSWVGDLRFTLTHEGASISRILIDRVGEPPGLGCSGDNISAILDDSAILPVEDQCSGSIPTISGTFFPSEALSGFNNQNINSSWTLKIEDVIISDGGTFNGWCMFVDYESSP